MKKSWYLTLAALVLMLPGCNKEMENPQAEAPVEKVRMTLTASLDEETRTSYADEKTFSWTAGDRIAVRMMDGEGRCGWIDFSTEESGPSVAFSAEVPADFHPTGLAYYSLVSIERDAEQYAADLNGVSYGLMHYFYPQIDNMDRLSVVPLIGILKEGSESDFSFRTAAGIVKIPLENVPAELDAVRLESESTSLCGAFPITEKGYFAMDEIMEDHREGTGELTIFPIVENGQAVVYFPLPVGTLPAGTKLSFLDINEQELAFKTTVKDVEITRNKIIQFPAMDVTALMAENPWESLGKAKMFDSMFQLSATNYRSVPIQRLKADPHVYRLVNPYGVLLGEPDASPYLTFQVHEAGEALNSDGSVVSSHYGIVTFEPHDTGYAYPYQDAAGEEQYGNIWLRCVNLYSGVSEEDFQYSIVIRQDAEGNPTHIQLAPVYYYGGGAFWRYYYNDMIQIAMPGYDPIDIAFWMNFNWSFESPEHPKVEEFNMTYETHEGIDDFLFALSDISVEDAYARLDTDDAVYVGPDHARGGQLNPQFPAEYGVFYVAVRGYHYGYVMNSFDFQIQIPRETASDEYLYWLGSWQADNGETWTVSAGSNDVDYTVSGLFGLDDYAVRATFNAQTGSLVFNEQEENLFYGLFMSDNNLYYYGHSATIFSVAPDGTVTPGYISGYQTYFIDYYLHNGDYDYPYSALPSKLTRVSQQPSAVPAVHSAHSSSPQLHKKTMSRKLVPIR